MERAEKYSSDFKSWSEINCLDWLNAQFVLLKSDNSFYVMFCPSGKEFKTSCALLWSCDYSAPAGDGPGNKELTLQRKHRHWGEKNHLCLNTPMAYEDWYVKCPWIDCTTQDSSRKHKIFLQKSSPWHNDIFISCKTWIIRVMPIINSHAPAAPDMLVFILYLMK